MSARGHRIHLSRRQRERDALQAEVARLSALVLDAEERGCKCGPAAELSGCPWCRGQLRYVEGPAGAMETVLDHDADCPAFVGHRQLREGPVE